MADLHLVAAGLLAKPAAYVPWLERFQALADRLQQWRKQMPDALMVLLFYAASRLQERYSSHHALVCATLVAECAEQLAWPEEEVRCVMLAALSMNLSITTLQDEMVYRERTPTLGQRTVIDNHSRLSAEMLATLGVTDNVWLGVVKQHHQQLTPDQRKEGLDAAQRLADLLRRVDIFAARLSPRRARKGQLPTLAVRDAYLGSGEGPDDIGVAMAKVVGIYPLGSFVTLASGDTALVVKRSLRPGQPLVVSLVGPDKRPLAEPLLRDTADAAHSVKAPAAADSMRLVLSHERLLKLVALSPPATAAEGLP